MVLVIILAIAFGFYKNKDVDENRTFTTGKIIGLRHLKKSSYSLEYEYYVDGKKLLGTVLTNHFKCDNENKCIGYEIDVFFSSKNPENSQAYLKKFDKYRTQLYFP